MAGDQLHHPHLLACALDHHQSTALPPPVQCHRGDGPAAAGDVYAVNSMNFHPVFGTFSTAGSDGTYTFWDKDSKWARGHAHGLGLRRGLWSMDREVELPIRPSNQSLDSALFLPHSPPPTLLPLPAGSASS